MPFFYSKNVSQPSSNHMKYRLQTSALIILILLILLDSSCKKDKPLIPIITTNEITDISNTTATSGGNLVYNGDNTLISIGICWSTNHTPTILDNKTSSDPSNGSFKSRLTDLMPNTEYYVSAYFTTNKSTEYGSVIKFTTLSSSTQSDYKPCGLLLETMDEMLKIPTVESTDLLSFFIQKSSGSIPSKLILDVPSAADQGSYNSCTAYSVGYGMMSNIFKNIEGHEDFNFDRVFSPNYIWNQLNGGINKGVNIGSCFRLIEEQGCCKLKFMPVDVAINAEPSPDAKSNAASYKLSDFYRIEIYDISKLKSLLANGFALVIGVNIDKAFQKNETNQFEEKSDGRLVWKKYTGDPVDHHAMLICGYDDDINAFKVLNSWGQKWGNNGYFWLDYDFSKEAISHYLGLFFYEIYVGIVKRPVISTINVFEITNSNAKSGGNIIKDWGNLVTESGICWSSSTDPTISSNRTIDGTKTGVFLSDIIGLSPESKYYVKAYATNSEGTAYGTQKSFTTIGGQSSTVTDVEGNVYKTVAIGTQTWMAENLKVTKYNDMTEIQNITINSQWGNLTTGAYCWYNNDLSNKGTFGALYNWYTVNTDKLCPIGWHVPSDAEWTTLENFLTTNGYNYDGTTTGNKIAKSLASSSGWYSSTTIGVVGNTDYPNFRNITGFNALPGGYRFEVDGFQWIDLYGVWWSNTETGILGAITRSINFEWDYLKHFEFVKNRGFSVRCLKDN
jgi:uncharacterized protein (TIGR02145 family)